MGKNHTIEIKFMQKKIISQNSTPCHDTNTHKLEVEVNDLNIIKVMRG